MSTKATSSFCYTLGLLLFGLAWIGVGIQHWMYLKFVATLVPLFMPWRIFWAGFTGVCMILAGASFTLRIKPAFTALLLSLMLAGFILLIHIPRLFADSHNLMTWTRALQDTAIAGVALMLTANTRLIQTGRWVYGLPLVLLGIGHFIHLDFNTAKVPVYFPAHNFFDGFIGALMIVFAGAIVAGVHKLRPALSLGVLLLIMAICYSAPLLARDIKNAVQWTTFLLDLMIASGAFIAVSKAEQ